MQGKGPREKGREYKTVERGKGEGKREEERHGDEEDGRKDRRGRRGTWRQQTEEVVERRQTRGNGRTGRKQRKMGEKDKG